MRTLPFIGWCLLISLLFGCGTRYRETSGRTVFPGTFMWDIETDQVGSPPQSDLFFGYATDTERYLEVRPGAGIALVPAGGYETLKGSDLAAMSYGTEKVVDGPEARTMAEGTTLAVRTVEGNYAKLHIVGYSPLHDFSFKGSELIPEQARAGLMARPNIPQYHMLVEWTLYVKR